jgi:hypothetical protein
MRAQTQDKCDDKKGSLYEELERVLDEFSKYLMNILLGDFNGKVGKEDIFKPTIGIESLHESSNDNGVRAVKFATSKNLVLTVQFSHFAKFINTLGLFLMDRHTVRLIKS